jgi:aminopeptidase N
MLGFSGMEYSGLVFLRNDLWISQVNQQKNEFLLAHEIAHQWWYGAVGSDQLREPWLDEGLANWSAYKYMQMVKGEPLPFNAQARPAVYLNRELKDFASAQEYYRVAYTGGQSFWFGLEEDMGSERVVNVLRKYYADYRFGLADTSDLEKCIQAEARKDMSYYYKKWFY